MRRLRAGVLAVLAGLLLAACGPHHSVRVEPTRHGRPWNTASRGNDYVVVRGDTMYGIAFRHGLDYRDLARLNRIGAPYTIYPGQRLRLPRTARPAVAANPPRKPTTATPVRPPPATAAAAPGAGSTAPRSAATPSSAGSAAASTVTPAAAPSKPPPVLPGGPPSWRWPAAGPLVAAFAANDPTRQGINIAGNAGQPIHAAADGVVVYSGSGLIGYGELVIIKHSDDWLSAYGHNRKRLAAEGETVRAGQQIAEMGRSGASRDMLHFEIRRNGKPVDPLGLLPKR